MPAVPRYRGLIYIGQGQVVLCTNILQMCSHLAKWLHNNEAMIKVNIRWAIRSTIPSHTGDRVNVSAILPVRG